MKKGFTLVEVLAVIAILGLVVAISIPKVVSTIKESNKKAFRIDAQLVLKTIDLKLAQGLEYDITTLDVETIKSVFGINNKNFKTLSVTIENEIPYISIEGKNEWEGFLAFGSEDDVVVTEEDYVDTVAPVISLIGASQVYLEAGAMYYEVGATAIDNHDGDITNKITMQGNVVNTAVPGTYVLNYAVSDYIGNVSSVTRTVTVLANAAPTVAFGMNGNSTYAKTRSTSVLVSDNVAVVASSLEYQWTTSTTAPTEASFTTTFTNGGTISSPAIVTGGYYLWILAKDTNNNTMIARSNVFNLDNTAPVITMTGSTPVSVASGTTYTDAGATALDNADGNRTANITVTSTVNTGATGTYTVTYNVSDSLGNIATAQVRTVNVIIGSVEYLIVAGGGAGGHRHGAGGGGGGVLTGSISLTPGTAYSLTVGAGGAPVAGTDGGNGGNSVAFGLTAIGGGGGASYDGAGGKVGGSGGGGAEGKANGAGTTGQGYAGGAGSSGSVYNHGGGGGAGGAGQTGTAATCGDGGIGILSSISGTATYYGGGGGGGSHDPRPTDGQTSVGGLGGGGAGGPIGVNSKGVSGTANTGGGGGGASTSSEGTGSGGSGGSGIVIVRYYGVQKATGGTITTSGGYTIHTFTASGTFTPSTS